MQRRTILAVGMLAAVALTPEAASAQFELSPRGIVGALTRPLRHLLPRHHRHHIARHPRAHETRAASRETDAGAAQPEVFDTPIWPDAYQQLVGYVFRPADYRPRLQQHGFGDIATAVIGPLPSRPTTVGTASRDTADTDTVGDAAKGAAACAGEIDEKAGWPADRIEQTMALNDKQRGAFEKFRNAYFNGAKSIKADCRNLAHLSPTRRLEAMEQRLWTVRDAGVLIREPLKTFYQSLNDEQKAKFNADLTGKPNDQDSTKAADAATKREQQECYGKEAGELQRFLKKIRETVRPAQKQRESFDALRKKSSQMAKLLLASCTQAPPATPLERLDAADTRLTAMNYAATTIDIALNDFYGQLSKDQKAKFDAMGR